jgi:glutathione S-transferase
MMIGWIFGESSSKINLEKDYPNFYAWDQRLMARQAVKKIVQDKQAAMAAGH